MKLLSFGEVLWDVYPDGKFIGGAPFNFAAHIAKHEHEAYLCTSVGRDAFGKETLELLSKFRIHSDCVSILSDKETGQCLVSLDERGVPSYQLLSDVAYDEIHMPNFSHDFFDTLYFGTLAMRSEFNQHTLMKILQNFQFQEIFVDINIRSPFYSAETIDFACKHATILKISQEELSSMLVAVNLPITNDLYAVTMLLRDKYPNIKLLLITCGDQGAFAFQCKNQQAYQCKAKQVEVVSTVGAGDSFSAAFLSKYYYGNDIKSCLSYAVSISATVASDKGAIPDYITEK